MFNFIGTTWTQHMVWNITHNLDSESNEEELDSRFPFLEYVQIFLRKKKFY